MAQPAALTSLADAVDRLNVRRLDLEEYHRLIEMGFFGPDDRVELIEGVLHRMSPRGPRHAECLRRLLRVFITTLAGRAEVSAQGPITIPASGSEPEPDLTLVVPREGGYGDRHPLPNEVLLVVEIAETSLQEDRELKLPVYAAAGIEEYWILNLVDDQIEVYRKPVVLPDGGATYRERILYVRGDQVAPLRFPDCLIEVADVLP